MEKEGKVKIEELKNIIPNGASIFMGSCCSEPQTLAEALANHISKSRKVEIYAGNPGSLCHFASSDLKGSLRIKAFYIVPGLKNALGEGWVDFIPCDYSDLPRYLKEGLIKPDIAMIQLSSPDENGMCSLGIGVDFHRELIECADIIIAEINKQMPRTCGNTLVPFSAVDYWIESDRTLLEIRHETISPVERQIGENVAKLIPDGACIQIGIGNISKAILRSLHNKYDLSIHSGTLTDGVIHLIEQGIVTNKNKKINPGVTVATNLMGTERIYRYAHLNPLIELHPITYTHNPATFLQLPGLIAINSALQVDLTGQVNAETINGSQVGGIGGQLDFMCGAVAAGGKSIIALPSTAGNGRYSRIVPTIGSGNIVTTPRTKVNYVVTEFGIACLKGKSVEQRAKALIEIAHPKFRKELYEMADKLPVLTGREKSKDGGCYGK